MFSNFIYFIIVLLIYSSYQSTDETYFSHFEAIQLFILFIIFFTFINHVTFKRLEKYADRENLLKTDQRYNTIINHNTILAIAIFTLDIYALDIPSYVSRFSILKKAPTLEAILFIGLYAFYLSIVLSFAYNVYKKIYFTHLSRRSFIISNISFSIPVLIPWFILSCITDIIDILPFDFPKRLVSTPLGEAVSFILFLITIAIISPLLITKLWKCKSLERGFIRSRIEELCKRAKCGYKDIVYWPIFEGKIITAGVMGLIKKFRYILVTEALLRFLNPDEIDAVISHEIGHVRRKHFLFYVLFFVSYLIFSISTNNLIKFLIIFANPVYYFADITSISPVTITSTIFNIITIIMFLLYFRYIFGYFMRNFERQADTYVFNLFNTSLPLISTLEKIAITSGQPPERPSWHHFSIKERIDFLTKCELDRKWIADHEKKVRKGMYAFLCAIITFGVIGYYLNFGETSVKINSNLFEKIILRELSQSPKNSELYTLLGYLYYLNNNYEKIIWAYNKAIQLNPKNSQALNNLAWFYATCNDKRFFNPKEALNLAKRATDLEESPHVLDTLAESYFINGYYKEAAAVELKALSIARNDREYFEKQLKKFERLSEN